MRGICEKGTQPAKMSITSEWWLAPKVITTDKLLYSDKTPRAFLESQLNKIFIGSHMFDHFLACNFRMSIFKAFNTKLN